MSKHIVAKATELPPGSRKLVTVKGRDIAVFNVAGEYFALLNRCPHRGGSLCAGKFTGLVRSGEPGQYEFDRQGEILRCPWHGWEFDIRTGQSVFAPDEVQARNFPVALAPGRTIDLAQTPMIESFPISVEDDYVVLTMTEARR